MWRLVSAKCSAQKYPIVVGLNITEVTKSVDYRICWAMIEPVRSAKVHAAIKLPSLFIIV